MGGFLCVISVLEPESSSIYIIFRVGACHLEMFQNYEFCRIIPLAFLNALQYF